MCVSVLNLSLKERVLNSAKCTQSEFQNFNTGCVLNKNNVINRDVSKTLVTP